MPEQSGSRSSEHLLRRVRGEFLEMPGLRLTSEQAQRLWGLDHETCASLLNRLVDLQFLIRGSDGRYTRLTEGSPPTSPLRMAKADISPDRETTQSRDTLPRAKRASGSRED